MPASAMKLPPGATLIDDGSTSSQMKLPPGATLVDDGSGRSQTSAEQPKRGVISQFFHDTFAPRDPMSMPGAKPPSGEMPGSFEGHPENIGEWVPAGPGEVAGGAMDLMSGASRTGRGNIARGVHRVISGGQNTVAPMAPFVAAAAPGQFVRALATGAAGQVIGDQGAQIAGADPDTAQAIGDVASLVGGTAGATEPGSRVGRTGGALVKPFAKTGMAALEDVPVVGGLIRGARTFKNVPGELAEIWGKKPTFPEEPLGPPTPDPALLKSGGLAKSMKVTEPSDALDRIPVRGSVAKTMEPQTAAPISRPSLHEMLDTVRSQIQEGLGGEDLNPKAPIRQQPGTPKAADLPEGHTPVTSTAVRSYKYDAGAKEFHARTASGDTTYVYGDVSPEDAQAFEAAESKGKAYQAIKGHPLVAKIKDGQRTAMKPSR